MADIRRAFTRSAPHTGLSAPDAAVVEAMLRVPRDHFVPAEERDRAWADAALSIGHGATISQPFIVALMTTLAGIRPTDRALEVGAGSGYQTAILAELAAQVFAVEIVPELSARCAAGLAELGYDAVQVVNGNGWHGLPEHAPFDVILVTACAAEVPAELVEQLGIGGRMVVPIGPIGGPQELVLVGRLDDGAVSQRRVLPVTFVPMVGRPGS